MGTLAGSKRKPGTPLASPSKAAASTKRSRTQYDYCDEEDSESFPEDRWSADDTDSWSDMSVDEDEDQICQPDRAGDKSATGRSQQDSWTTQEPGCMSLAASMPCGSGLTKSKTEGCPGCSCSRVGRQCNTSNCRCEAGPTCHNPLNKLDLAAIFGKDGFDLHPCFTTWITEQSNAGLEWTSTRFLFDIVFEAIIMLDEYKSNATEPYLEWRAKWDSLTASEQDSSDAGLALKQELLRWGLTCRDSQSVYFSFCRKNGWVETDHEWHCDRCGGCRQWKEWHCLNCNQCSYGLTRPCGNCGGDGDWSPGFKPNEPDDGYDLIRW
ncbi:hypothetical protein KVR01_001044 [Diaporthe batatas]|uniref:uncharacterized protein n=1 Tax=Diaporthe batatas TaxID=748121 RepID=UPI001D03C372|nr:uncharacterized protein KVR01_001044 [Diaporthe batatas]KAG8170299.1 hypothetical protein KVR01_001044 [Diaporthe batatas]